MWNGVVFFWRGHFWKIAIIWYHISKPFRRSKNSENYKNPLKKYMFLASKISGSKNKTSSLQVDTFSTHRTEFHVGNGTCGIREGNLPCFYTFSEQLPRSFSSEIRRIVGSFSPDPLLFRNSCCSDPGNQSNQSVLGASKNRGTPKWMVQNGKPCQIDDLGVPLF